MTVEAAAQEAIEQHLTIAATPAAAAPSEVSATTDAAVAVSARALY